MTSRVFFRSVTGLAAMLCVCGVSAASAAAAIFTVDDFNDRPNTFPCVPEPSVTTCSLRQAIQAVRNQPAESEIDLLPGTYTLDRNEVSGSNNNADGDLDIGPLQLNDVYIRGAGSGRTTINATGLNDRILDMVSSSAVTLDGVTLAGGFANTPADGFDGGSIRLGGSGPLGLVDVKIVSSSGSNGNGGAIASSGASLDIDRSYIKQNFANGFGGAIAIYTAPGAAPHLTVRNSTFDSNSTLINGGGAIANMGDPASPGNTDPIVDVTNSTFDGNRARGFGGAIDTFYGATTNLTSTTVTRNKANANDDPGGEAGGGLQNGFGTYVIKNSLIVSNTVGAGGVNPDCSGNFGSMGGNVVGNLTGCNGFGGVGDVALEDLANSSPGIGLLSANGGPTPTVPLLAGSVAIDHTSGCPATDQRGVGRPQGAACDTGAFEFVPPVQGTTLATPVTVAGPTGQRAAALRKCKKKRTKKARKKCKKKAKRLPL